MADACLFIADGCDFQPTEWGVGPWSADTLQGSAYGGLLVRALERSDAAEGMALARLSLVWAIDVLHPRAVRSPISP